MVSGAALYVAGLAVLARADGLPAVLVGAGLLIGVAMPKKSSALVTSLAGSALWLSAGVALLRSGVEEPPEMLNQPPLVWAVLWGVVAVAGMAVQFGLLKRKDGKKAEGEGD